VVQTKPIPAKSAKLVPLGQDKLTSIVQTPVIMVAPVGQLADLVQVPAKFINPEGHVASLVHVVTRFVQLLSGHVVVGLGTQTSSHNGAPVQMLSQLLQ